MAEETTAVFYLDTNVLHFVRLYLIHAKNDGLPPYHREVMDMDVWKDALRKDPAYESLKKGGYIFRYFQDSSEAETNFKYSPITRLELLYGILKGKSITNLSKKSVPFRMWTRLHENELEDHIGICDFDKVCEHEGYFWDELKKLLGGAFYETAPKEMYHVWMLAKLFYRSLFLSVGDSVIYSGAVLSQANELVTDDGYLAKIVNRVFSSDKEKDKEKYVRVKEDIRNFFVKERQWAPDSVIVFPEAQMVRKNEYKLVPKPIP